MAQEVVNLPSKGEDLSSKPQYSTKKKKKKEVRQRESTETPSCSFSGLLKSAGKAHSSEHWLLCLVEVFPAEPCWA
jgi:hypothetical protein